MRSQPQSGNLPANTTSFVGRQSEIAAVRSLLSGSRLLTIVGTGGVGKTRLAIEVAREIGSDHPDGAWLVDLAPLAHGADVAPAVYRALGMIDRSPQATLDKLTRHLAGRSLLLVLDNCEHVIDQAALLTEHLLQAAPELQILATSRRGLELTGEQLYELSPLSVPAADFSGDAAALSRYDAVNLLVERARSRDPQFRLSDENSEPVARLCARLDGVPLAIELAATRLRSLAVATLLERIDDRFALLTAGSRASLPRQQTLRALIDWSHELCSPLEQLLWARLSVFSGSFDLETIEGVCSDQELQLSAILDVLDSLVAQSVVVRQDQDGVRRYRLLETIREYGAQRLAAAGGDRALRVRHFHFYLNRAQTIATGWCGPDQANGLRRLRDDHDNLRAAFEFGCQDRELFSHTLALVVALRQHWYADVFLGAGRRWLDRALALPAVSERDRAPALWVAAWVSLLQGDRSAAYARLDECDRAAERSRDRRSAAFGTSLRGTAELFSGHIDVCIDCFERAISEFRELRDFEGLLSASFQLGIALGHAGRYEEAIAVSSTAAAAAREIGESWGCSSALWAWGYAQWRVGRLDAAAELTREALRTQAAIGDPVIAGLMIELLGWIAASRGDTAGAARLLGLTAMVWPQVGTDIVAFGPHHAENHERCVAAIEAAGLAATTAPAPGAARLTVDEAIERALAEPEAGVAPTKSADVRLTAREREVAQMIVGGLTNRQIAETLVVSPRTVDRHVENLLAKLGFRSRAQIAAWMAARDRELAGS